MKKLKNRRELALYLNEIKAEVVAEVGVREGHYSKFILDNTKVKKLYAIDPWEKNSELTNDQEAFLICHKFLDPFGERAEMVKAYSPQAAENFQDESLDFVYIDGLHEYEAVKSDIAAFYPKVKKNGIIAGHDYHQGDWPGVYNAVNEFIFANDLELNVTGIGSEDHTIEFDGDKPSWWTHKK